MASLDSKQCRFICDFQLNLKLAATSLPKRSVFPPFIKLIQGSSFNSLDSNALLRIRNDLITLWNYNTNNIHTAKRMHDIKSQSAKYTSFGMLLLLCFILLFAIIVLPLFHFYIISELLLWKLMFLASIALVIILLYICCYCKYRHNIQINQLKANWRKRFIQLLQDYLDELQAQYADDTRFVILFPDKVSNYWYYIRVTKGVSKQKGESLFYSPPVTSISSPIRITTDEHIKRSTKKAITNLDKPLLININK